MPVPISRPFTGLLLTVTLFAVGLLAVGCDYLGRTVGRAVTNRSPGSGSRQCSG
jgi:hypothetical protein